MTLSAPVRRTALVLHITASAGWTGAVLVFLALAVSAAGAGSAVVVRSAVVGMDIVGTNVLLPLALLSLLTGLVGALGTPWGLVRHYWVVVKLLLSLGATAILVLHLGPVDAAADIARQRPLGPGELAGLRTQLIVQAAAAVGVLLFATVLSVFKPKGLTRYGWRKRQAMKAASAAT